MAVANLEATTWKSPVRKLIQFFERSRDLWKAKYVELKRERKGMENQVRAVEKSRAMWSTRAQTAEQRVAALEQELAAQKKTSS